MATLGIHLNGKTYAWTSGFSMEDQTARGLRQHAAKLMTRIRRHQAQTQMPNVDDQVPAILSVVPGQSAIDIAPLFAQAARASGAFASDLANRYGHEQIEPLHLFVACLQDESIATFFGRLALPPQRLEAALKHRLQSRSLGKPTRNSETTERVLLGAFRHALERGRKQVSVLEVFAATYAEDPFLQELFVQHGVEQSRFWQMVEWLRIQERAQEQHGTGFVLIGRETELGQLIRLVESSHNPILLVGSQGVGKGALVAGLSERIARQVSALNLDPLIELPDFESRIESFLPPTDRLLVATVTPQAYRNHLERTALGQRFETIEIQEPDLPTAVLILASKIASIEAEYGAFFPCEVLERIVEFSDRYLHREYLPKKAIDIAREVAARVVDARGGDAVVTADDIAHVINDRL